jgi:hypothetical protein
MKMRLANTIIESYCYWIFHHLKCLSRPTGTVHLSKLRKKMWDVANSLNEDILEFSLCQYFRFIVKASNLEIQF